MPSAAQDPQGSVPRAPLPGREIGLELDHLAMPVAPPVEVVHAAVAPPPVEVPRASIIAPPVEVPRATVAPPPVEIQRANAIRFAAPSSNLKAPKPVIALPRLAWLAGRRIPVASFCSSALVHAVLLVVLGLWVTRVAVYVEPVLLTARIEPAASELPRWTELPRAQEAPLVMPPVQLGSSESPPAPTRATRSTHDRPLDDFPAHANGSSYTLLAQVNSVGSDDLLKGLSGRGAGERSKLLNTGGGNAASENAVERGLQWLKAHQSRDGSWRFDHSLSPQCNGACQNPGKSVSSTAATALGLLPFLAAGHTHRAGNYQPTVEAGLYYLRGHGFRTNHGADFQEGTMYAQGLVTIALAEGLAMTGDQSLREPAEAAIEFIVYAQDKNGGGWRYTPGQPGDMTVTGWQLMALRSGQMNYLRVPGETMQRAVKFLDAMGQDYGATYGYLDRGREPVSTAVGLLCRMYTGWRRDHPPLASGIRYLNQLGPSRDDIYFNFYATQVMHHWGGAEWQVWNKTMRDYLVDTQSRSGHEAGSWYFEDAHRNSVAGGRLFNTCLAILTLEVYYRYLPLYDKHAVNDGF